MSFPYTYGIGQAYLGNLDIENDTLRVLLVDEDHTPSVDHDFVSSVVADEVTGSGYTRPTLSGAAVTIDDTDNRVEIGFDAIEWAAIDTSTATSKKVGYAILYKFVTDDSDSFLIGCYTIGKYTNGGSLELTADADGALRITPTVP